MKLKPFAFIIITILYILIHLWLSKCIANAYSKYRIYTASLQRAHGTLEDPTALPQHLSNTLWKRQVAAFVLSMLKINAAAWRSRRLHSVAAVCTARTSAICIFFKHWERCKDATLVWQGFYLWAIANVINLPSSSVYHYISSYCIGC